MSQIITPPSEILRRVCTPVRVLDKRVRDILEEMIKTLKATKEPEGVGLAAPQIGVPLRIFLARPDPKGEISIFINPEIIKYSQRTTRPTGKKGVYEGCLSIPGHYAPVTRSMSVTVKYQTLIINPKSETRNPKQIQNSNFENSKIVSGFDIRNSILQEKTSVFSGFIAHVIQHEMDHLNGILFIDRVLEQDSKLYRVVESLPAGRQEWEEVGI